jgi:hypothetical protein
MISVNKSEPTLVVRLNQGVGSKHHSQRTLVILGQPKSPISKTSVAPNVVSIRAEIQSLHIHGITVGKGETARLLLVGTQGESGLGLLGSKVIVDIPACLIFI